MIRDSGIIEKISSALGIIRGKQEAETLWSARVIYSAAGRIALASLWDMPEDEQPVSITHFKRRAEREIKALASSSDDLENYFNDSIEAITNEIYDIYLNTGYLYHTSNHIEPVPEVSALSGRCYLLRGSAVQETIHVSGVGLYSLSGLKKTHTVVNSIYELYRIPQMNLGTYIDKLLGYADWKNFSLSERAEFLRTKPPFTSGYWCGDPDNSGNVSLLRLGPPGSYIYYLYKCENRQLVVSPLAQWMTDGYEYRQIACGLLTSGNVLPDTTFWHDGELTHVHLGYLYPPKIQNFFKLYSWPESMTHFPSDFRRVMTKEIFNIFRMNIEPLGYGFCER